MLNIIYIDTRNKYSKVVVGYLWNNGILMLYFVRYGEERELKQITYSTSEMCVKRNLITGDSPANITLDCLN